MSTEARMIGATPVSGKIVLQSSDHEKFELEKAEAMQSVMLKNMIEDGMGGVIPVPFDGKILAKVVEYCRKHGAARSADDDEDSLNSWDAEFVKIDISTILDIITAANFLDIYGLFDLTCQSVADIIASKNPEEIREFFNIKNDLSVEEEEKIRKDNKWAFDKN